MLNTSRWAGTLIVSLVLALAGPAEASVSVAEAKAGNPLIDAAVPQIPVAVVRTRLRALRKALHDAVANDNISSSEKARIERRRKDVKDKPDPVRQRRDRDCSAAARIDPPQPVNRRVVDELGDHDVDR
jgi:hypothetical protein